MKIDENVTIPRDLWRGRRPKYPFKDMAVGDSLFAPEDDGIKMAGAAGTFSYRYKQFSFVSRIVIEGGVRGVRVWRVA